MFIKTNAGTVKLINAKLAIDVYGTMQAKTKQIAAITFKNNMNFLKKDILFILNFLYPL